MRVLRIDSWEGDIGGAQVYVRSVADALTALGHPQHLLNLVPRPSTTPRADEEFLTTAATPRGRLAADLGADGTFERTLHAAVDRFRPNLIHLHRFDAMFTPIARALSTLGIPVVFTAHDAELVCPISTLIRPGGIVCEGGVLPRCMFTGCRVGLGVPYNLRADLRAGPDPGPPDLRLPVSKLPPCDLPPPARLSPGDPPSSLRSDPGSGSPGTLPAPRHGSAPDDRLSRAPRAVQGSAGSSSRARSPRPERTGGPPHHRRRRGPPSGARADGPFARGLGPGHLAGGPARCREGGMVPVDRRPGGSLERVGELRPRGPRGPHPWPTRRRHRVRRASRRGAGPGNRAPRPRVGSSGARRSAGRDARGPGAPPPGRGRVAAGRSNGSPRNCTSGACSPWTGPCSTTAPSAHRSRPTAVVARSG